MFRRARACAGLVRAVVMMDGRQQTCAGGTTTSAPDCREQLDGHAMTSAT